MTTPRAELARLVRFAYEQAVEKTGDEKQRRRIAQVGELLIAAIPPDAAQGPKSRPRAAEATTR